MSKVIIAYVEIRIEANDSCRRSNIQKIFVKKHHKS